MKVIKRCYLLYNPLLIGPLLRLMLAHCRTRYIVLYKLLQAGSSDFSCGQLGRLHSLVQSASSPPRIARVAQSTWVSASLGVGLSHPNVLESHTADSRFAQGYLACLKAADFYYFAITTDSARNNFHINNGERCGCYCSSAQGLCGRADGNYQCTSMFG